MFDYYFQLSAYLCISIVYLKNENNMKIRFLKEKLNFMKQGDFFPYCTLVSHDYLHGLSQLSASFCVH